MLLALACGACASSGDTIGSPTSTGSTTAVDSTTSTSVTALATTQTTRLPTTTAPTTTTTIARLGVPPPDWLGTLELVLRAGENNGVAEPTPPELVDRRLWTMDVLDPPTDDLFIATVTRPPPTDVIERSTWRDECPVGLDELAYVTVAFVGFDGLFHTGELIVHNDYANGVVDIFGRLHELRFPIEEMRVTTQADVDAHPTGDSNNTSSFVCRPSVNSSRWSRHAHGGAIDINPFHNPYRKGDLVLPELASAYLDRSREVPGMITPEVVELFANIGWGWGGNWTSLDDWMHFSDTGN